MSGTNPRWTIAELGTRLESALAGGGYVAPVNGQVRAVPDLRTIRYYTTLGLLDRPLEMRGRTALYGWRHLLQLVAIKRLQAEGLALGEVQARLGGLDDRALARIAKVERAAVVAEAQAPATVARREARFWEASPSALAPPSPSTLAVAVAAKIELAPGVHLVVETAGAPGAFDVIAGEGVLADLARKAAPLVEELRRLGLVAGTSTTAEEKEEEPV